MEDELRPKVAEIFNRSNNYNPGSRSQNISDMMNLIQQEITKARLDEQERTDGAYMRFHVKESAEGDHAGHETDWISRHSRLAQLSKTLKEHKEK